MRIFLLMLASSIMAAAIATPAKAQDYPWCEYLSGGMGGSTNCGFVSWEQCMESVRGNGSDCRINTQYTPPAGPHQTTRKPQKNS
jgi:Protein of unknown function (DUF3551)